MVFQMTPQCRTALTTLVALVSIIATLLAAAAVSVDSRVAQAVAPIKSDVEVLKSRQNDALDKLRSIQEDVTWLVRQQASPK